MDLKEPGNVLFLVGITKNEMGGSHYHLVNGLEGGARPQVDLDKAPRLFNKLHAAIRRGLIRSCHDLSEGGLAVAIAEMAFAGGVGADLTQLSIQDAQHASEVLLFSESNTRFLAEVTPVNAEAFQECLGAEVAVALIGHTVKEPRLRMARANGAWIVSANLADLKETWQKPLR